MPRLPRIYVEGAIYYVTAKAIQNEEIFKDKEDYMMYLDLVTKYKAQHNFRLYSYCLLPDRLELLVETREDASISEVMHDLNSLYTKYFNGRYQKKGHLFESRFRSVLVEKTKYLVDLTRHIHLSSARHPKTSTQEIANYPYSSFQIFVENNNKSPLAQNMAEEVKEVLNFLKQKNDGLLYEQYVLQGDPAEIEFIEKSLKRGQVLGSPAFDLAVKRRVEEHAIEAEKEKQPKRSVHPVFLFLLGGAAIIVFANNMYLYKSKNQLEDKYTALLAQKEAEFGEKTKFENRSPLALKELEGSSWIIELIPMGPASVNVSTKLIKIQFENGKFHSDNWMGVQFPQTNFSLNKQSDGNAVWETIQTSANGDTLSWRGDWRADAMKGVVSFKPAQGMVAGSSFVSDYTFFSHSWDYVAAEKVS